METVTVGLGGRAYPIHIGHGTLDDLGEAIARLRDRRHTVVVSNPTVAALYQDRVVESLTRAGHTVTTCELPDGERFKNLEQVQRIYDHLLEQRLGRGGLIVALGGGVVGDMAGFAAATYLRGIDFVQVPTTVVAQVDSSVGGKTGVNHPRGKNLIGAFHQPCLVYMDMQTLTTLPRRELVAGLAEVVKYGVIADADFFDTLTASVTPLLALDAKHWADVVRRCCEIKAQVVAQDERETSGRRAILNYGHTLGHAVEATMGYGVVRHGEAVAMGMAAAAQIAVDLGRLDIAAAATQDALLARFGLPTALPGDLDRDVVIDALGLDKKTTGDRVKMVLANRIGDVDLVPLTVEDIARRVFTT